MADVDSKFPGIKIRNDDVKNPTFPLTINEWLGVIAGKSAGKALLDDIKNANPQTSLPYKVLIRRASSDVDMTQSDPGKRWAQANVTVGANMEKAYTKGQGTPSVITFNPNIYATPDGTRPPFIGLAHELIHARNNLLGESERNTKDDESKVVGLGAYVNHAGPTENKIRSEHGIALRSTYEGVL